MGERFHVDHFKGLANIERVKWWTICHLFWDAMTHTIVFGGSRVMFEPTVTKYLNLQARKGGF